MAQSITSSYDSLPPKIKPCFLFLGLFPVGFEFSPKKLAKLWCSEGFIEEIDRGHTDEYTAKEYLKKLSQRCMIQEASRRYDGLPKTYRIDDTFRQMCIAKAEEYGFFAILDDGETSSSFSTRTRRLAVHKTTSTSTDWYAHVNSFVSSTFCFRGCTVDLSKLLDRIVSELRVLHLEGSHIHQKTLPANIGRQALYLRYLNLRDTGIESLPSSIGNLVMLEFLDLRGNHIIPIPTAILKLRGLKELHMDSDTTSMDGDSIDVSSLTGLHTLSIRAGRWMEDGLGKLGQVKNLRIFGDLGLFPNVLHNGFEFQCNYLQFFRLGIGFGGSIHPLLVWLRGKPRLRSLELKRPLGGLPAPNEFPYLTYLCLKFSQLKRDPMPTLEQLPHLEVLRLRCGSFLGEKMVCSGGGFVRLQVLELAMLNELEEWMVEENAMPILRRLVVCCCNRLKMLPQGLHHLERLRGLVVSGMPETFNGRIKGEDWNKIRHVISTTVDEIQVKAADASNECTSTADDEWDPFNQINPWWFQRQDRSKQGEEEGATSFLVGSERARSEGDHNSDEFSSPEPR